MSNQKKIGVGTRVKVVPQHWLRGGEIGQLVRFEQRGQNNWLVKFARSFPGGGIDGDKLWLGQREFVEASDEDISMNSVGSDGEHEEVEVFPSDLNGSSRHYAETKNGTRDGLA
jgi:hypothetical protein